MRFLTISSCKQINSLATDSLIAIFWILYSFISGGGKRRRKIKCCWFFQSLRNAATQGSAKKGIAFDCKLTKYCKIESLSEQNRERNGFRTCNSIKERRSRTQSSFNYYAWTTVRVRRRSVLFSTDQFKPQSWIVQALNVFLMLTHQKEELYTSPSFLFRHIFEIGGDS